MTSRAHAPRPNPLDATVPVRSILAVVTAVAMSVTAAASTPAGTIVDAASPPPLGRSPERDRQVQTTFESVDAVLAAQWDFPARTPAPLVVLIPSQGRLDRDGRFPGLGDGSEGGMYAELTTSLVAAGFAVFRFDKPGAGRSAPGHFATERSNAIEAYTRAVDHARIDKDNVFVVAHGVGSDAVAGIYSRYQEVVPPRGVVLLDNAIGERMCLEIKAPLLIVNPNKDPDDRYTHCQFVVEARNVAPGGKLVTELVLVDGAEPGMLAPSVDGSERLELHPRAITATVEWLRKKHADAPASARATSVSPPSAPTLDSAPTTSASPTRTRFADKPLLAFPRPDSVI